MFYFWAPESYAESDNIYFEGEQLLKRKLLKSCIVPGALLMLDFFNWNM